MEIAHHAWDYPRGSRHPFTEIVIAGSEARIFGLHLRVMFSKWHERRRAKEIASLGPCHCCVIEQAPAAAASDRFPLLAQVDITG
ncbi:MAG TPA: hypothetical protein VI958_08130 [Acidobacteriota bacterium]